MKNKIIAVMVALSLVIAAILTANTHESCTHHFRFHTQMIVRVLTENTVSTAVACTPTNHNWQEYALTSDKIYEVENPADYMDGLTAISKRCIYVGEASNCRLPVKMTI